MIFLSVLYIVFLTLVGVDLQRRQLKRQGPETAAGAGTEVAAGPHQQPLQDREVSPPGSTSSLATYGGDGTVPRAGEKHAPSKGGGGGGGGGGPREERGWERRESSSRISIVVPALGSDLYSSSPIDDLVASISGQTTLPHELIVVMSGANSSSCSRMHGILAKLPPSVDPKLNCTGEEILRQHVARNIGVGMVSGDIVSFIDADDVMHRHKVEVSLALFRESPALKAIFRNPPPAFLCPE